MKFIFGLGNPGRKYTFTRHNIGFQIVDKLVLTYNGAFRRNCRIHAHQAKLTIDGEIINVYKPYTFMNNSGQSVKKICSEFSAHFTDILIVYDEIALPLGTIRFRERGSSGGHRGIESIIDAVGSQSVNRLRIGIASDEQNQFRQLADFVLSRFTKEEQPIVQDMIGTATQAIRDWISCGSKYVMERYNKKML